MGALAGGRRSDLPCCPLAPRQTEAGQRVALCRHCTDINTMAGKGWKMPLQAQSARGNVTGRNHLPNNAQETCQAGDLSLLVGTHLAAVTSQGFDKTSSRLKTASFPPRAAATPLWDGWEFQGAPALFSQAVACPSCMPGGLFWAVLLLK